MPRKSLNSKQRPEKAAMPKNKQRKMTGGELVIWLPAPPVKGRGMKAGDAAGSKPGPRVCDACGHKIPFGSLATHKCEGITKRVGRVTGEAVRPFWWSVLTVSADLVCGGQAMENNLIWAIRNPHPSREVPRTCLKATDNLALVSSREQVPKTLPFSLPASC